MSSDYDLLLDATIGHLQALKESGQQFIQVQNETLQNLGKPVAKKSTPTPPVVQLKNETKEITSPIAGFAFSKQILSPEAKTAAMAELHHRAMECQKCSNLATSRKNVVFGVGDIHSELMFIGEAPGADEDEQGEPFVGKAGQLLTRIIQAMGYSRDSIYIANVLKCRPDTPGQLSGNRKPTQDEMNTCLPFLQAQMDIIKPKVIVALGATAMEGLLGRANGIMKLRGNWQSFHNIPVMPTYHPAYLLRNQAITEKRKVWEDMLKVLERLNKPISEKQRNFFLKAV